MGDGEGERSPRGHNLFGGKRDGSSRRFGRKRRGLRGFGGSTFLPQRCSDSARCPMEAGAARSRNGTVSASSAAAKIALLW